MSGWRSQENEGVVSYRLSRERTVTAFREGRRTATEVCDAQPELRRVAHHHAAPLNEPCPICEADELVTVTFAFGTGLPKGGRLVADLGEMKRLRQRGRPSTCYSLEICRSCWWNHLRESYALSGEGTSFVT